jgi:hypothetical protein
VGHLERLVAKAEQRLVEALPGTDQVNGDLPKKQPGGPGRR